MTVLIDKQLEAFKATSQGTALRHLGETIHKEGCCQIMAHGKNAWEVLVETADDEEREVKIHVGEEEVFPVEKSKPVDWSPEAVAALFQIRDEIGNAGLRSSIEGKIYTREGMMKRVLEERRDKAEKLLYKITFADNIYGEHRLINERGVQYLVTLRDFERETGYINNPDLRTNKLGTTKHIMYAFRALKSKPKTFNRLSKRYPFVEIYVDPQHDYRITWYYPHRMSPKVEALITKYFGKKNFLPDQKTKDFLLFIRDAANYPIIKIRPEVEEKVRKAWEAEMLERIEADEKLDFSPIKTKLFPYQREGVRFATFREGAILADEMGLGKTIQAIATAVMKKKLFGFKKTLIVCPASLKDQWRREIEKFSHEQAVVVDGLPGERRDIYRNREAYFVIVNYETVLRDIVELNQMQADFVILDEAQRIKNFSTVTAANIKKLERKHALVMTGTPIENRLTDLYSVMQFVDPNYLAPLWEFSYQHCYFDPVKKDRIVGYYDLQKLKKRMEPVLLRREKSKVLKDLPRVTEIDVPVNMHPLQADYHAGFAKGVASILSKKYISPYDMQRLMLLLANMRMVCDCTYLIDKETYHSPKLVELEHILTEKFDLAHSERKIIIFSEWTNMLHIIGQMLRKNGIGYAQLSGKVAVKHRAKLVKKFETDPNCKVFLSTEAGGSGLNLQVADTVINFELPWNPAKKNQRIGRIDRLGQRNKQLTVINLITRASIEMSIVSGLTLKQSLFDGVLSDDRGPDEVDFSASNKAQFLRELEMALTALNAAPTEEEPGETAGQDGQTTIEQITAEEEIPVSDTDAGRAAGSPSAEDRPAAETMEKVLNNGMEFLSGLLQMATGKNVGLEGKKIEIDPSTGEIVMRFKLPTF